MLDKLNTIRSFMRLEALPYLRIWSGDSLSYNFTEYVYRSFVPPMMAIIMLPIAWVRGHSGVRNLILCVLAGYLVVTVMPCKDIRFFLPILPLLSLATWLGILLLPWSWVRRAVAVPLIVWAVLQVGALTSHWVAGQAGHLQLTWRGRSLPVFSQALGYAGAPQKQSLVWNDVLDILLPIQEDKRRPVDVLFLSSTAYENYGAFIYVLYLNGIDPGRFSPEGGVHSPLTDEEFSDLWRRTYDIVLCRRPNPGGGLVEDHVATLTQALDEEEGSRYRLLAKLPIQEGGFMEVHEQISGEFTN